MRFRPRLPALLLACAAVAAAACSTPVDLENDIEIVGIETGYFDNGLKDGKDHMLPQVSFRIRNVSDHEVTSVLMTVAFWVPDPEAHAAAVAAAVAAGQDPPTEMTYSELSSVQLRGVSSDGLAPGAETETIVARPAVGYTLEVPRSEFFLSSRFRDVTARLFARRSGALVQVGEYQIDRRILASAPAPDLP